MVNTPSNTPSNPGGEFIVMSFTPTDIWLADMMMDLRYGRRSQTPAPQSDAISAINNATDGATDALDASNSPNAPSDVVDQANTETTAAQTPTVSTPATTPVTTQERSTKTVSARAKADRIKALDCDALTPCSRCATKRDAAHRCLIDPNSPNSACGTCTLHKERCDFVRDQSTPRDPARRLPQARPAGHVTTINQALGLSPARNAPPEIEERERQEMAAFKSGRSSRGEATHEGTTSENSWEAEGEKASPTPRHKRTPLPNGRPEPVVGRRESLENRGDE